MHTRHTPFFYTRQHRKLAVLIHGFMGSPYYFARWSELFLDAGFDCKGILLPGHNLAPKEFSKATAEQWLSVARGEVAVAEKEYDSLLLVGHSLGGLISLILAAETPKVEGVLALNPAIGLHARPAALVKYAKYRFGRPAHDDEKRRVIREQVSVEVRTIADVLCLAKPMKQLRKVQKILLEREEQPICPVIMFRARRDETVSGRAMEKYCASLPLGELVELPCSTHDYYPESDREIIETAFRRMMK